MQGNRMTKKKISLERIFDYNNVTIAEIILPGWAYCASLYSKTNPLINIRKDWNGPVPVGMARIVGAKVSVLLEFWDKVGPNRPNPSNLKV